jgi:hypothetical protein
MIVTVCSSEGFFAQVVARIDKFLAQFNKSEKFYWSIRLSPSFFLFREFRKKKTIKTAAARITAPKIVIFMTFSPTERLFRTFYPDT